MKAEGIKLRCNGGSRAAFSDGARAAGQSAGDQASFGRPVCLANARKIFFASHCRRLSGDLSQQGERFKTIRAIYQEGPLGDKLANEALAAEAALYNTQSGSTTPGVKPGTKAKAPEGAASNPWSLTSWHGTEAQRQAEKLRIIKVGSALAAGMATRDISGPISCDPNHGACRPWATS
jgi:hypothetical protein